MEVDLAGRVFMVTGANSGIGKEVSRFVAAKGGTVYMVCRSKGRAEEARNEIVAETNNENVHILLGDCSLQEDVRRIHREFADKEDKLNCLVCNAGALHNRRTFTR